MKWLNLGPWPYFVGFTTEVADYDREMRRLKCKESLPAVLEGASATTHFFASSDGATAIIVMPPHKRKRSREQYAALLAHEAMHVVQDMRTELGDLGKEAEAYLMQQVVQEGLQTAWNTGRVRKTRP